MLHAKESSLSHAKEKSTNVYQEKGVTECHIKEKDVQISIQIKGSPNVT